MLRKSLMLLVVVLAFSSVSLFAQSDRKTEFALGYSNLQGQGLPNQNNLTGIFGSDFFNNRSTLHGFGTEVTAYPSDKFGLTGDFSFNANTAKSQFSLGQSSLETNVFYFMGGPSVSFGSGKLQPFGHFLAGGAYTRFKASFEPAFLGNLASTSFKVGATDFALGIGGGLDVPLSGFKLRVLQVDYTPIFLRDQSIGTLSGFGLQPFNLNGNRMDNVRFTFGVVF